MVPDILRQEYILWIFGGTYYKDIHCLSDSKATTFWFQFWEISIDHEEGIVP